MTQGKLFKTENDWREEWLEMPEYNNTRQPEPLITALFKFRTEEDFETFKNLVQEHIFDGVRVFDGIQKKQTKSSWYPHHPKPSSYEYI
jgi:hypothetical protein